VDLISPFVLASADDLATPYTNYTSGYKALLDYVWHDPTVLAVTRQLPCPPQQLLGNFIPSPRFPSDHLAVVYDLVPVAAAEAATAAAAAAATAGSNAVAAAASYTVLPALAAHADAAAAALRSGGAVLMPSDTLYGVAADASSSAAVAQLRAAKRRAARRPLAVAVADAADVSRYCQTDGLPPGLLAALLPGPVTLLLPVADGAPLAANIQGDDDAQGADGGSSISSMEVDESPSAAASGAWSDTESTSKAAARAAAGVIGIRVPQNEFVRRVVRGLGGAVALSSANVSGGEAALELSECRWVLCCAVLCCAVLCCAVLCCAVLFALGVS